MSYADELEAYFVKDELEREHNVSLEVALCKLELEGVLQRISFKASPENVVVYYIDQARNLDKHISKLKNKTIVQHSHFIVIHDANYAAFIIIEYEHLKYIAQFLRTKLDNYQYGAYFDEVESYKSVSFHKEFVKINANPILPHYDKILRYKK